MRKIACLACLLILCMLSALAEADNSVCISNSEWNNKTRTKVITVEFDSNEYCALDYTVRAYVWCRIGKDGQPRQAADAAPISLAPKRIGGDWLATGTRDIRIEYHELFGTYPERRYCYYRYLVTCEHNGETWVVRESGWNPA